MGGRLLLLDQDSITRERTKHDLQSMGYEVIATDNQYTGPLALQLCPPYGVLLDVNMLRNDGFSLLVRLRALDAHIPIFMMGTQDRADELVRAMQFGATDYLLKPINLQVFKEKYQRLSISRLKPSSSLPLSTR